MSNSSAIGESAALREARGLKGGWVARFGSDSSVVAQMMITSMIDQNLPLRADVYRELAGLVGNQN
ncbi:hypothetical protein KZ810_14115 [Sphingomonas sp. RHCKR47]|uniref:hypothetical protein n=1 Tax=Sphingomonas citricola TaxID=2862498 RepID=UPI001CA5D3D4|nr:hypothetical protein [Sphingomonas citricola]MBW6524636.1 hypothetical protein [Sphingomonas citricola]